MDGEGVRRVEGVFLGAAKACLESAETQKQRGVGGAGISRVDGAISSRTKRLCAVVQTPPPPGGSGGPSRRAPA